MTISVSSILDKITGYATVLDNYNYKNVGAGHLPWSIKHICDGKPDVSIRGSEWTVHGEVIETGTTPEEFDIALTFPGFFSILKFYGYSMRKIDNNQGTEHPMMLCFKDPSTICVHGTFWFIPNDNKIQASGMGHLKLESLLKAAAR